MEYCAAAENVWRPDFKVGPLRLPIIVGYSMLAVYCENVTWSGEGTACKLDGSRNTYERCSGCDQKASIGTARFSKSLPINGTLRLRRDGCT